MVYEPGEAHSNTATDIGCVNGGGGSKCDNAPGNVRAPGWTDIRISGNTWVYNGSSAGLDSGSDGNPSDQTASGVDSGNSSTGGNWFYGTRPDYPISPVVTTHFLVKSEIVHAAANALFGDGE